MENRFFKLSALALVSLFASQAAFAMENEKNNVDNKSTIVDNKSTIKDNKSTIKIEEKKNENSEIKIEEKKDTSTTTVINNEKEKNDKKKTEEKNDGETKGWSLNFLPSVKTVGALLGYIPLLVIGKSVEGIVNGYKGFTNAEAIAEAQNTYDKAQTAYVSGCVDAVDLAISLLETKVDALTPKILAAGVAAGEAATTAGSKLVEVNNNDLLTAFFKAKESLEKLTGKDVKEASAQDKAKAQIAVVKAAAAFCASIFDENNKVKKTEENAANYKAFINAYEQFQSDLFAQASKIKEIKKVDGKEAVKEVKNEKSEVTIKAHDGNEEAFKAFADFFGTEDYKKLYVAKKDAATALFCAKHWIVALPITHKKTTAVVAALGLGLTAYALLTKRQIPGMSTLTRTFGLLFSRFASKNVVLPQPKLS